MSVPAQPLCQLRRAAALASLALTCAMASSAEFAANPDAKVPAVAYRSVFKETSLGVEKGSDDWRKANDAVGKYTRGHIDILKQEEQDSAKAMPGEMEKPAPARPSGAPEPKPGASKPIAAPAHKH